MSLTAHVPFIVHASLIFRVSFGPVAYVRLIAHVLPVAYVRLTPHVLLIACVRLIAHVLLIAYV